MTYRGMKDLIIRFSTIGFFIGLLFLILSFIIPAIGGSISFTFNGFIRLHRLIPVQVLFDLLPFIGGITGFFIAGKISGLQNKIRNIKDHDHSKTEKIRQYMSNLLNNKLDEDINIDDIDIDPDIASSLTGLKRCLQNNIEKEKLRKQEDHQREWISAGLERFGEILRIHTEDLEEFSFNIISHLVKYLDFNQGGFFLVEEKEDSVRFFNMKACYAYDRKKFPDKQIEWGEGLIGSCALEKQTVYLTDIPDSYLTITSGIGLANPKYLLIVPVVNQQEVIGIIELASFRDLKPFEIQFIENVAGRTAIALSELKNNIRTAKLLKESQQQAETLARQEEEMRKSQDQLKNILEEAAKFVSFTNSVNHTLIRAEYNMDGTLLYANTKFISKLGYSGNSEVEGKHISMFINAKDREWFDKIWERLSQGGKHYEGYMKHVTKLGQDLWTMATYTCERKEDGSVDRILFLAIDTTEQRKLSLDYEGQIDAINRLNIKVEFAPDGKFINCNDLFFETVKYNRKELEEMTVFDFIDQKDLENFNEIWENIIRGVPYQGQVKGYTKYEDEKWFRASYTSVHDMYGEVYKVVYIGTDITNEKMMEIESQKQTDQIKIHEEKVRLASIEMKKKLDQTRSELKLEYEHIERECARLNKMMDNLNEIILTIDESGIVHYINRSGERFWNINRQQIIGQSVNKLFHDSKKKLNDFLLNLIPENGKKITGVKIPVILTDSKNRTLKAEMIVSQMEELGTIFYTALIILV